MNRGVILSRNDTAWLRMDSPINYMVVNGYFQFDERLEVGRIKEALRDGLLKYDRFRQRVIDEGGASRPRWVDDEDFDLDRHVFVEALPEPGDEATLRAAMEAHLRVPLSTDKPLWEMYLYTGLGSGCVLFFRVHHCIADGIALMQVLLAMCERVDGAETEAPLSKPARPWWWWLALPVTGIWWLLKYLWVSNYLLVRSNDSDSVYKGELGGVKRTAWTAPIPLERVKAVAAAAGVKINDLLMATAAGALRRYAAHRGEPLDGKTLRVIVPVNLRSASAAEALGNEFALVTPDLPVDHPDPSSRIRVMQQRMNRLKKSPEPFATVVLLNLFGVIGMRLQQAFQSYLVKKGTLVMSNVPGPRMRLAFASAPISRIMFWVPSFGSNALGISVLSYAGEVTVGVITDEEVIADPEVLAEAFSEELEHLGERFLPEVTEGSAAVSGEHEKRGGVSASRSMTGS